MAYLITNQRKFAHIPYPSKSNPSGNIKTSGCGACSMLMIVENLVGERWKMADWAKWVISTGARVNGGTSLNILGKACAKRYDMNLTMTSSETELANHLKKGGMAIANVGGNRSGWTGIFSTAGHYVAVLGIKSDGRFIVADPNFYASKFQKPGVKGKVTVDGELVYIKPEYLHLDTLKRTPNYYLFSLNKPINKEDKKEETKMAEIRYSTFNALPDWGKEAVKYYMDAGKLKGTDEQGSLDLSYDMLRILCIVCPTVYKNYEDLPDWAKPQIKRLMDNGALKGDGTGLNLTLDMVRTLVIEERDEEA